MQARSYLRTSRFRASSLLFTASFTVLQFLQAKFGGVFNCPSTILNENEDYLAISQIFRDLSERQIRCSILAVPGEPPPELYFIWNILPMQVVERMLVARQRATLESFRESDQFSNFDFC